MNHPVEWAVLFFFRSKINVYKFVGFILIFILHCFYFTR